MTKNKAGRADARNISGYHTVLSISSYYAQIVDFQQIALGITKDQMDIIPNLSDILQKFGDVVETINPQAGKFNILAPFGGLTKSEIVQVGVKNRVPFELTWSCLHAGDEHCGECVQCVARKKAFLDSHITDPTDYLK